MSEPQQWSDHQWRTHLDPEANVRHLYFDVGEYRWLDGSERRVGVVAVPSCIEANFPPVRDGLGLLVIVGVVDGAPGCTGVEFYSQDGARYVRPKDLEWLCNNLDNIVESMVRETSKRLDKDGGSTFYPHGSPQWQEERTAVAASLAGVMKGSRRRQTDMHLREVVKVYRSAKNGRDAVRRAFPKKDGRHVDMRTVDRWIKSARGRGLFDTAAEPEEEPVDMSPEAQRERADAALATMNRRAETKGGE